MEEGGREEGPGGQRPGRKRKRKRSGKGRSAWQVFLLACFLCCSTPGNPEGGERGQGEHCQPTANTVTGQRRWRTETQWTTDKKTDETGQQNGQKKKKKTTRTPKKARAMAQWFGRLFKGKEDTEEEEWVWGVPMSEEARLRRREEAQRRVGACLEAYRVQQEREEARQERLRDVRRYRKAREAAVTIYSSLPPRADTNRAIMYRDVNDNEAAMNTCSAPPPRPDNNNNRAVMDRDVMDREGQVNNKDAAGTRRNREKGQNARELTKRAEINNAGIGRREKMAPRHTSRDTSHISHQSEWEEEESQWQVEIMGLIWALAIYIVPMIWVFADDTPCEY
ncbi:uncharacterized protein LOC134469999 [Engraulis encrasicolus]|uniref:uncharacterized protein LOC134469999 n=1 Tax=Engraulis encrasicolus TaxID=184585 RepID=UPI002FD6BF99